MSRTRGPARRSRCRWLALLGVVLVAWAARPLAPALAAPAQQAQPLPPALDLDAVAAQAAALHRANGGATVNLCYGDLAGQDLYVVVVYPELSETVPGPDLDAARIRQFIADHLALLSDPRNNVGTWVDDDGNSVLDVSSALPDRAQAIALAQQYNQMGVFDLAQMETIDTGGTGAVPAGLPPVEQRLPPIPAQFAPAP
ncbi:MAG TPA: hypothetical protein VII06_22350 [Chloroflexota bacterium]|jgi:hypothetical protein